MFDIILEWPSSAQGIQFISSTQLKESYPVFKVCEYVHDDKSRARTTLYPLY